MFIAYIFVSKNVKNNTEMVGLRNSSSPELLYCRKQLFSMFRVALRSCESCFSWIYLIFHDIMIIKINKNFKPYLNVSRGLSDFKKTFDPKD